jgi:hypothetical protein
MLDALHPNDNSECLNTGAEWMWRETLALRAGYQSLFQTDSELGLTMGVGIRSHLGGRGLRVDYGWADHERLDGTHRITVAFGL